MNKKMSYIKSNFFKVNACNPEWKSAASHRVNVDHRKLMCGVLLSSGVSSSSSGETWSTSWTYGTAAARHRWENQLHHTRHLMLHWIQIKKTSLRVVPETHSWTCLCCFVDHVTCVIASCINLGTGVYFYWNFTISLPFPLIHLFCTRYTESFLIRP